MITRLCLAALTSFFFAFAAAVPPASAATATFHNPMYQGNRLDWCRDWSIGCGKEAATAYCKSRGFDTAIGFSQAPNIGAAHPTRLIGTGAVCDQGFCDGFSTITCFKQAPAQQVFVHPMYNGKRLDWCRDWGVGCGHDAAEAYCKSRGFAHTLGFSEAVDIGATHPTRLIGTGAICDQGFCDGFQAITCGN